MTKKNWYKIYIVLTPSTDLMWDLLKKTSNAVLIRLGKQTMQNFVWKHSCKSNTKQNIFGK